MFKRNKKRCRPRQGLSRVPVGQKIIAGTDKWEQIKFKSSAQQKKQSTEKTSFSMGENIYGKYLPTGGSKIEEEF